MQNKAVWLETTPTSFKVRVSFLPMSEAEAKRCSNMLMGAKVTIASVTTQGPLSADLVFESAPPPTSSSLPVKNSDKKESVQ